MSVAKYVEEIILLQPVEEVWKIERLTPYNRNSKKKDQGESFDSLFKKARERHATTQKESNGFDVLC